MYVVRIVIIIVTSVVDSRILGSPKTFWLEVYIVKL